MTRPHSDEQNSVTGTTVHISTSHGGRMGSNMLCACGRLRTNQTPGNYRQISHIEQIQHIFGFYAYT